MNYADFEAYARRVFEGIPPEYREGVDGLEVTRATVPHPSLADVYTLGECKSEFYPSEFGGAGEIRSFVVLYYGSFLALSRLDEDWDWEHEIWETVTHEVRHHLESLAAEDALDELDYAEDQNFARREGVAFDPFFFHSGIRREEGVFEVDGDWFVELPLDARRAGGEPWLRVPWRGGELRLATPEPLADIHYLRVPDALPEPGELFVVLVRRRGALEWIRGLFSGAAPRVAQEDARLADDA